MRQQGDEAQKIPDLVQTGPPSDHVKENTVQSFSRQFAYALSVTAATAAAAFFCAAAGAQPVDDIGRPTAVVPLASEPAPKLVVYAPLPAPLARGVVIVQHRTENARIIPIFGQEAVEVSPRVGHLHVTVDDRPGTWAHTSVDPIIVMGLTPGAHKIRVELADPNHKILASETVAVTVPEQAVSGAHAH